MSRPAKHKKTTAKKESLFVKNLKALSGELHNCSILDTLQQLPDPKDDTEVVVFPTETPDDYTLCYEGVALHDPVNAMAEAIALVDEKCNPGSLHNFHLIIGLGLGYVLEEVFRRSDGRIYIYEPNATLLKFMLSNVDFSEFFASNRVHIATSMEDLSLLLKPYYVYGCSLDLLLLPGYKTLLGNRLEEVATALDQFMADQKSVSSAQYHMNLRWLRAFLENTPYFPTAQPFDALRQRFAQVPAVVVSPGPSLEKALPHLRDLQDRTLIIAVCGAARLLLENGITPDYVAAIDYQTHKFLKDLPGTLENSSFILGPFADSACFGLPAQNHYVIKGNAYVGFGEWTDQVFESTQKPIRNGGSVAVTALECAVAMGCSPITLVGQDLCIQNGKLYASGNLGNLDTDKKRFVLEAGERNYHYERELVEIPGQNGETMWTIPDYHDFWGEIQGTAKTIEKQNIPIKLYNSSIGGAFIPGFTHLPIEDVFAQEHLKPLNKKVLRGNVEKSVSKGIIGRRTATTQRLIQALRQATTVCINWIDRAFQIYLKEAKRLQTEDIMIEKMMPETVDQLAVLSQNVLSTMGQNAVLAFGLYKERWAWFVQQQDERTLENRLRNLEADRKLFKSLAPVLKEQLQSWLDQTCDFQIKHGNWQHKETWQVAESIKAEFDRLEGSQRLEEALYTATPPKAADSSIETPIEATTSSPEPSSVAEVPG